MADHDDFEYTAVDDSVDFADFGDVDSVVDAVQRRVHVDSLIAEASECKRHDYDRLKSLADEAFERSSQLDETRAPYRFGMAASLSLLAHLSTVQGESDDALLLVSKALSLLASSEPCALLGELHLTMGTAHYESGDYVEALNDLTTASRIAEEIDDPSLSAYVMDQLANVYTSTAHADSALDLQLRAVQVHRELGDVTGEALALNNMAYTYLALDRTEDARGAAMGALHFAETTGRQYMLMGVFDTVAEVLLNAGELELAIEYAVRGLELANIHHSEPNRADALMTIARLAHECGDLDEALASARSALALAQKLGRSVEEFMCYRLLSEIEERRGEYSSALQNCRHYHELERKRLNDETESRIANLQVEHQVDNARKNAEIHRLRSLALEREVEERKIANAELEAQASLDPLTGLFNRRHISVLSQELRRQLSQGLNASLILFDIDHFKEINDTHGHFAGDRVLVSIARMLGVSARECDTPCRYGGDEFLVLLSDTDHEEAHSIAERIRTAIAAKIVEHHGTPIPITVSVGVATARPDSPSALLRVIERADRALYAAKNAGRNCIVADTG